MRRKPAPALTAADLAMAVDMMAHVHTATGTRRRPYLVYPPQDAPYGLRRIALALLR